MTQQPEMRLVPVALLSDAAGVLDCEGYDQMSADLLACIAAAPRPDHGVGDIGWLIEDVNESQWLTPKPSEALWSMVFTKDSLEAIRFPRRVDAEDYVRTHLDDAPVRITEHSWPCSRRPQSWRKGVSRMVHSRSALIPTCAVAICAANRLAVL